MLFFGDRTKLNEMYKKWLKTDLTIKDCSFNVISFLSAYELLDYEKTKEFINKGDFNEK